MAFIVNPKAKQTRSAKQLFLVKNIRRRSIAALQASLIGIALTACGDSQADVTNSKSSRYSLVAKASGGTYDITECVKDNSTGLVWEGKNPSGSSTRASNTRYTNYDSTSSAQKWNGSAWVNPTQTDIDASTNSIGYRNSVRTLNLCGYNDWRLPTKEELAGILASSGIPKIDTTWFPNTQAWYYWTSSPDVGDSGYAWGVGFYYGSVYGHDRNVNYHVRLVR